MRQALTIACLVSAALIGPVPHGVIAQGQERGDVQRPAPSPKQILSLAFSSATLQARAAQIAAERETRPEVRRFAQTAVEFRTEHLRRLEALARDYGLTLPAVMEFEHQVILENLEPLDFLALSRRYAEVQVQALEQELQIYQAALRAPDEALSSFARQTLPQLEQQLEVARKALAAVQP